MMLAVLRTEATKQWRRPRTWVALGVVVLVPVIITVALEVSPPTQRSSETAFFFLSTRSGLFVPVAALRLMSRLLLVIVVALFAGDAVASEANWGSLRALLTRPIARGRLLAGKLVVVAVLAVIATYLVVISGLLAGGLAFGFHGLDVPVLGLHRSAGDLVANLALASSYVGWSLGFVVAAGFMLSTMTDSPAGAVLGAVGVYMLSQILDAIEAIGSVRNWLPTHYLDAWFDLFTGRGSGVTGDMARGAALQLGYIAAGCAVAWWWFRRKDILS